MGTRRRFSREFKVEAVKLVCERGVTVSQAAHAYQAASYEHELGSEVPTRLPFTNILLSISRI